MSGAAPLGRRAPFALGMTALALVAACGRSPHEAHEWRALDGSVVAPEPGRGTKAVVWVFVTTDCTVANAYAPELTAIAHDFRDVADLWIVHVDPTRSDDDLRAHALAHGHALAGVIADREHRLVARAGATMTPEAAVFDANGQLRYLGRIDDRVPELGVRRPAATRHELRACLLALRGGEPIETAHAPAVGCVIETLEPR